MGDYYEFEIQVVDNVERFGFCYQNKNTNYNEIFVELTESQRKMAINWQRKHNDLIKEKDEMIKAFLGG